jgi:protoporphyrinogen oxidase
MLVFIFSPDAVATAAKFAASLREDSSLMASALASDATKGKQIDASFAKLGQAIKTLLNAEANSVVAEGNSGWSKS